MFAYRCLVVLGWLAALPVIGVGQPRPAPPEPSLGDLDRELSAEPAFRNPKAVLDEALQRRGGTGARFPKLSPDAIGVKGPTGVGGSAVSLEPDTMRRGSDYRDFGLPVAQPELCRDACAGDPACKAYGYSKPGAGTHGSTPWCYLKNAVPPAVRYTGGVAGVKGGSPTASGGSVSLEPNTRRQGSDYRDFGLSAAQPELCRDACASDPTCKAYGYSKPGAGTHGSTPWCYLKNAVPPAVYYLGGDAGVKGSDRSGSTPGLSMEVDTMRRGSDYRDFGLAAARPELCRDACAGDPTCKAYGYTKPGAGTHGSSPWCYLKNAVPAAVRHNCCVAGVKSGSPTAR